MIKCPNCGASLDDGARFCGECGTPAPQPQVAAGISMGNKNVVAGDIIGKKEDFHVAGHMINRVSINETDKVLTCHACGKHVTNVDGYTCPSCGNFVCKEHFDRKRMLCVECIEDRKQKAIARYREIVAEVCVNGKIDAAGNQRLYEANMFECHLSPKLTAEIRDAYINEVRGPSELEKLDIEKFDEEFNANRCLDAYNRIQPIYRRHPTNEEILIRYIRSAKKADPTAATEFIRNLKVDVKEAYLASADIYLQHNQLAECEKMLQEASSKWSGDLLVNSAMARYFAVCAKKFNNAGLLSEAEKLLDASAAPANEYEQGSLGCARAMVAFVKDGSSEQFNQLNAYWASLLSLLTNEITVAQDGSADYTTIAAAISACGDGAKIAVKPGCYAEILNITKSVVIEGVLDAAGNKPVLVRDGDSIKPLMNISASKVKISNIDFVGGFVPQENYFGSMLYKEQVNEAAQLIRVSGKDVELDCVNAYRCFGFGLVLQNAENIRVTNSNFFHNQKSGVCAFEKSSGVFKDCFFAENGNYGFQHFGDKGVEFDNSHELNNRFGFFTDERDGEVYRTVKIGKQTWMCENLRYDCGEGCFFSGHDEESKRAGAFYTWPSMMGLSNKITFEQSLTTSELKVLKSNMLKQFWQDTGKFLGKAKIRGIAPEGWRIPSGADFAELINYCQNNLAAGEKSIAHGMISVRDSNDAKSTDYYGFSALFRGSVKFADGQQEDYGKKAKMWTLNLNAADTTTKRAYALVLTDRSADVLDNINRTVSALNVRCILDEDSVVEIADGEKKLNDKIDSLLELYSAAEEMQKLTDEYAEIFTELSAKSDVIDDPRLDEITNRQEILRDKYGF